MWTVGSRLVVCLLQQRRVEWPDHVAHACRLTRGPGILVSRASSLMKGSAWKAPWIDCLFAATCLEPPQGSVSKPGLHGQLHLTSEASYKADLGPTNVLASRCGVSPHAPVVCRGLAHSRQQTQQRPVLSKQLLRAHSGLGQPFFLYQTLLSLSRKWGVWLRRQWGQTLQ